MPTLCSFSQTCGTSSEPVDQDIKLMRGDDVVLFLNFTNGRTGLPVDWTGWSFMSKAKSGVDGTLWTTATVIHDGTGGLVTVVFPNSETSLLTPGEVGRWDLQGIDPIGYVRTIVNGDATVLGDIT